MLCWVCPEGGQDPREWDDCAREPRGDVGPAVAELTTRMSCRNHITCGHSLSNGVEMSAVRVALLFLNHPGHAFPPSPAGEWRCWGFEAEQRFRGSLTPPASCRLTHDRP